MTIEQMRKLWPLAKVLHEARRDLAWGSDIGKTREPWPEFSPNYTHARVAYIDLALEQADAAMNYMEAQSIMTEGSG